MSGLISYLASLTDNLTKRSSVLVTNLALPSKYRMRTKDLENKFFVKQHDASYQVRLVSILSTADIASPIVFSLTNGLHLTKDKTDGIYQIAAGVNMINDTFCTKREVVDDQMFLNIDFSVTTLNKEAITTPLEFLFEIIEYKD